MAEPNNRVPRLRAEQIEQVEAIIGYQFRQHDKAYLWEALQIIKPCQARVTRISGRIFPGDNQKPALLGDGLMGVVFLEYWSSMENSMPDDFNHLRQKKLDNGYLSKVASRFDLMSCTDWPWIETPKKLATLVEAIIGAVYSDSDRDMRAVKRVMIVLGFVEVLEEIDLESDPASQA